MDLQVALISLGVIVLSAAVVYLISILGTKETSYEEAVAEQRRKGVELLGELTKPSTTRDKGKQHAKKWGRKSKERGGEHDHNGLHVDFKTEAEIIPDDTSDELSVPPVAARVRRHSDEPRSILVTKRVAPVKVVAPFTSKPTKAAVEVKVKEPTPPKTKEPTPPKTKEPTPPKTKELTPVEVDGGRKGGKKEPEVAETTKVVSRESSKEKEEQHAKKEKSKEREIVKAVVEKVVEKVKVKEPSPPSASSGHTKTNLKQKPEGIGAPGGRLAALIKTSSLSNDDIQTLVEALLNKRQNETESSWLKAGQKVDPVDALRKQLEEREQTLNDESTRAAALATKLKEAKQELQTEKSRATQLERVLKEGQQEVQVARKRSDQAVLEAKTFQTKLQEIKAKNSEENSLIRKVQEENKKMKLTAKQLESKCAEMERERNGLRSTTIDLSDKLADLKQTLDQQCQASDVAIRQLQEQLQVNNQSQIDEMSWKQPLAELSCQVERLEREKAEILQNLHAVCAGEEVTRANLIDAKQRLDTADRTKVSLEFQTKELRENLNNTENHAAVLQGQIGELQNDICELRSKLSETEKENGNLREELDLLGQDVIISERQEAEGQEGSGETSPKEKTNGHIQVAEPDLCPSKTISMASHESIILEKDKLMEQISSSLVEQKSAAVELGERVEKYKVEVTALKVDIERHELKNNELRKKNSVVMDAKAAAEKQANDRLKQVEKLQNETEERLNVARKAEQNLSKEVLQRIFPSIRIEEAQTHPQWIEKFEKRATECLAQLSEDNGSQSDVAEAEAKLAASEDLCSKLQGDIQLYKTVLSETEAMLNKLQSSVEEEELRWKDKFAEKEKQLEKYGEEKKSLDASLLQIRAAEEAASEMQDKLRELQQKLQMEEGERRVLEENRTAMDGEISRLQAQLRDNEEQITRWKLERESSEEKAKELEAVREELVKEKQTCKTLTAQNVKLNSLVKIGQDALKAETDIVVSLEGQVNALKEKQAQNATTNGSPLASAESPESQSRRDVANSSVGRSPTSSLSSLLHQSTPTAATGAPPPSSSKTKSKKRVALGKK